MLEPAKTMKREQRESCLSAKNEILCTLIDDVRTCLRQGYGKASLSEVASRALETP